MVSESSRCVASSHFHSRMEAPACRRGCAECPTMELLLLDKVLPEIGEVEAHYATTPLAYDACLYEALSVLRDLRGRPIEARDEIGDTAVALVRKHGSDESHVAR